MASWLDRLKPLKRPAGLNLITGAALLLLVSGSQAFVEDEPAARAPLPPLLRSAPTEAGEPRMPDPAPSRNQSDPRAPAISFDRSRSQLSQKKPRLHSTSYRGASVAKKRETPARLGNPTLHAASRRQGNRAVVSEKSNGGAGLRPSLGSASFHPLATIPIRGSEAPANPHRSRGKLRPFIIPITLRVRPHMVMPRAIPMHGHHPDPGSFGKGEHRCEGMQRDLLLS